jgi:ankyrin repeat protein
MNEESCFEDDLLNHTIDEVISYYEIKTDIDVLDSFGDTLLLASCKNRQLENVAYLLKRGANPNFVNDCGEAPLHEVIDTVIEDESTSLKIISLLLDSGADIETRAYMDKTPFLKACSRSSLKVIKLLVERGCDVQATVDEYGEKFNAIYWSCLLQSDNEIVKYVKSVYKS